MSERHPEDDYFVRLEAEKKEKLRAKLDQENKVSALEERRLLHRHKCGKCGADMTTQGFRGVDIEVCPDCGAVLLDPGELEALAGKDSTGALAGLISIFGRK